MLAARIKISAGQGLWIKSPPPKKIAFQNYEKKKHDCEMPDTIPLLLLRNRIILFW